jgi:hypothetical protein
MSRKNARLSQLRDRITSLSFATPQIFIAAISAAALIEAIQRLGLTIPRNVNTTILLPLKAGLAGVLAAALLAFWGFFWTEVNAPSTERRDLPSQVRTYRRWFAWLVPALLLLFVSVGADFYLVLINKKSLDAAAVSFGTFGGAMFMIGLFVLAFTSRTALEMSYLIKAGEIQKNKTKQSDRAPEQAKAETADVDADTDPAGAGHRASGRRAWARFRLRGLALAFLLGVGVGLQPAPGGFTSTSTCMVSAITSAFVPSGPTFSGWTHAASQRTSWGRECRYRPGQPTRAASTVTESAVVIPNTRPAPARGGLHPLAACRQLIPNETGFFFVNEAACHALLMTRCAGLPIRALPFLDDRPLA